MSEEKFVEENEKNLIALVDEELQNAITIRVERFKQCMQMINPEINNESLHILNQSKLVNQSKSNPE